MSSTKRNLEGRERRPQDFYETPEWFVHHLAAALDATGRRECLRPPVLDLGCGRGRILRVLRECGVSGSMVGIEIDSTRAAHAREAVPEPSSILVADVLTEDAAEGVEWGCVVSNPPFSLARDFVRRALDVVGDGASVLILQRWAFPITKVASPLFAPGSGFVAVYPCSSRPSFVHGATDSVPYAWFHWIKGSTEPPPFLIFDRPPDPRQVDLFPEGP